MKDKLSSDNNSNYSPPQNDSNAQLKSYDPDQYDKSMLVNKNDKSISVPRGINCGQWTQLENKRYIKFLEMNRKNFTSGKSRRQKKIFNKMSKQIRGRNPDQCRGHHEKKIKRFGSVEQIINFYKNEYQEIKNLKEKGKKQEQMKLQNCKGQDKTRSSYIKECKEIEEQKIRFVIESNLMIEW